MAARKAHRFGIDRANFRIGSGRDHLRSHGPISIGIGAPESVDGLLRIADDDELSGTRSGAIARQAIDDPRLRSIGVLKLSTNM